MAALSDYLESGLLNHVFRGGTFDKPSNISLALTSGIPQDSNTGSTLPSYYGFHLRIPTYSRSWTRKSNTWDD